MLRNFFINAVLMICGVFLSLGAFDVAVSQLPETVLPDPVRKLALQLQLNSEKPYRRHPALGYAIKPATDFVYSGEEFSFRFQTHLNFPDAGFRGGTLGGPVWGAAFGDSFTFGVGVDQDAAWVAQLSKLTNREIINFGVPGHGPYRYTQVLKTYGAPLRPKVVFYALFANDLKDARRFEKRQLNRKRKFSIKQFLKTHSASYNLLNNFFLSIRRRLADNTWDGIGLKLLDRKLRHPHDVADEDFAILWTAIASQIDEAVEESRRLEAAFILLYFPSKEEVYWRLARERVRAIDRFEERIEKLSKTAGDFCRARRLLCLDLTQALQSRGLRGEKLYFPEDIHWNERGHRVVAQEIHKFLIEKQIGE